MLKNQKPSPNLTASSGQCKFSGRSGHLASFTRTATLLLVLASAGTTIQPAQADQVEHDFRLARQELENAPGPRTGAGSNTNPYTGSTIFQRATHGAGDIVEKAMDFLGIRYRRGGSTPESGFDCSGFVSHVFRELGTRLPRSSREISHSGEAVSKNELQPGDLVFFNTMRRAFSHVGIYLGNNQFVHAPASGGAVRIDDLRERYWGKRYNGARRVPAE